MSRSDIRDAAPRATGPDIPGLTPALPEAAVPPPAPLEMPVRGVREAVARRPRPANHWRVHAGRMLAFGGALALTVYATVEMWLAVTVSQASALQIGLLAFFVLTFSVIAFSASSALAGLLFAKGARRATEAVETDETARADRADRASSGGGSAEPTALPERVALVMPLYNESVAPCFAALLAMAEGLHERDAATHFEIFVLSDSNRPETFVRETAAFARLRTLLAGRMQTWYRRRQDNEGRKAGNVKDFVTKWGGRYAAMIMLDADSVMHPDTLITLAHEMKRDPHLGILQTVPRLVAGRSMLGRMQQFASHLYGPIVGRGIDAWQGNDGNYWGHNAIIRVTAFAQACGLPELPGRKPFGGSILSHDFVEAAWIRRAGWSVRMAPQLEGSWEGSPPTLLDVATRDRRWAQGNLQHAGVLRAQGLTFSNRAHFVIGIFSYLASPLWLGLMTVGIALAIVATLTDPVYFGPGRQLFPTWPRFDSERMVWLFAISIGLLILPKLLGLGVALCDRESRRRCGGARSMLAGGAAELVLSACYAPIMMLMQTQQIWQILRGRDSGWATQNRAGEINPWSEVLSRHAVHTIVGIALFAITWWTVPQLSAWLAPTILGLTLAIPLSRWSGHTGYGAALRRRGVFVTPEELELPAVMARREALVDHFVAAESVTPHDVLSDPELASRHFAGVAPSPPRPRGAPPVWPLLAGQKIAEATHRRELLTWLTAAEVLAVLGDEELCARCHALPASEHPACGDS